MVGMTGTIGTGAGMVGMTGTGMTGAGILGMGTCADAADDRTSMNNMRDKNRQTDLFLICPPLNNEKTILILYNEMRLLSMDLIPS